MEHADSADLLSLGQHCCAPDCQQNDFLPFKCDCCHQIFCLEHRTYQKHACTQSGSKETSTIVCPVCAKAVKLSAADDPNVVFERHTRSDCDPSNYAKVHQRPRCPAHGCREKLGAINTYTCKECGKQVCLKHRFAEDHQCPGRSGRSQVHHLQQTYLRHSCSVPEVLCQPLSLLLCSCIMHVLTLHAACKTMHQHMTTTYSVCVICAAAMANKATARSNPITQAMRSLWGSKPDVSSKKPQAGAHNQKPAVSKAQHAQRAQHAQQDILRGAAVSSRSAAPIANASRSASAQQQRPAAEQQQRPASAGAQPSQPMIRQNRQGQAAMIGRYTVRPCSSILAAHEQVCMNPDCTAISACLSIAVCHGAGCASLICRPTRLVSAAMPT